MSSVGTPGAALPGHVVVVDLSYGDAGKGTTVESLVSRGARSVVRFNGGAQAAHNVVTPEGRHHTFAQFGSGTLQSATTFLSRFMVLEPYALVNEAEHLSSLGVGDPWDLLWVDPDMLVTTPYHQVSNQHRERSRERPHGSCGVGFGETVSHALTHPGEALRVGDLSSRRATLRRLQQIRSTLGEEWGTLLGPPPEEVADFFCALGDLLQVTRSDHLSRLLAGGPVVFEGAQGVLLDEWQGFHPHTTWSTTTYHNADLLLAEAGAEAYHLGVLRTYTTRHGHGPHVSADPVLDNLLPEPHNATGLWQGDFRRGHLDLVAHRYALEIAGRTDGIMLTHADQTDPRMKVCVAYNTPGGLLTRLHPTARGDLLTQERLTDSLQTASPILSPREGSWAQTITQGLGVEVVGLSHGPTRSDKVWSWDALPREHARKVLHV